MDIKHSPYRSEEDIEEMMMMMMNNSQEVSSNESITFTTCSSWKLYENPIYYSSEQHQEHCQVYKQLHRLRLPSMKVSGSFKDLNLLSTYMDSEFKMAQAQIMEFKAELENERKARKKLESANRKLAKGLAEERCAREALERVCEELAKGLSSEKAEVNRMKKDLEEEKKMLRMAEVLREERVQMKLSEAKIFLEQRLQELEESKQILQTNNANPEKSCSNDCYVTDCKESKGNYDSSVNARKSSRGVLSENYGNFAELREISRSILREKPACNDNNNGSHSFMTNQRKSSPEPENPHIKRGIKGFVEFPRVVRAVGSKSKQWGSKLECQKAQLRILLKQKCPIKSTNLIIS